jgi:hypothetical protein
MLLQFSDSRMKREYLANEIDAAIFWLIGVDATIIKRKRLTYRVVRLCQRVRQGKPAPNRSSRRVSRTKYSGRLLQSTSGREPLPRMEAHRRLQRPARRREKPAPPAS